MNMFAKNSAASVEEYINNVPEDRRDDFTFLHEFIQKNAPKLKPYFASNMPGYGSMTYLDSKKRPIEWPIVALANQKNYISLYVCSVEDGEYVAEKRKGQLGKVDVGKSCIRIKKLSDVNLDELKKVLQTAEESPGMVGATIVKD